MASDKPQPELAKYQPCGCILCTCEHETQCQGCGAHHCGTHPVGQIPAPVYQQPTDALNAAHAQVNLSLSREEIELIQLAMEFLESELPEYESAMKKMRAALTATPVV